MWCNPSGAIKVVQSTHSITCIICVMQHLWRWVCGAICAVQSKWCNRYNAIYQVWGGTRSDARRKKIKRKKKAPMPAQARARWWRCRLQPSLGGQGAGRAVSEPPTRLRDIMRAGLHASCDEDARPRLPSWKWPATGRGKIGGVGRGKGEPVRETEKHARGEIWVEKIHTATPTKTQSRRPLARGKIPQLYHHVFTALSPHPSPDWPADDFDDPKPSSRSLEMRAPTPEL